MLNSWNDTETKKTIIDFVKRVTTPGEDFLPVSMKNDWNKVLPFE